MSLPQFPTIDPPITREDAINQIISSIAMEEVAISHIINAEGEKLQYVLGTITGAPALNPTFDQILEINESVRGVLQSAAESQAVLRSKLQNALTSAVLRGPTGATGPTGPEGQVQGAGLNLELKVAGTEVEIPAGDAILFNTIPYISDTDISYDAATGTITANQSGVYDFYNLNWSAIIEGYGGTMPYSVSVVVNGAPYSVLESNTPETIVSWSCLVPTGGAAVTIQLVNTSDETLELSNVATQAQLTLVGIKAAVV